MSRLSAALIGILPAILRGRSVRSRGRKPNLLEVSNLEIHAWHGCNLACESCSHYSSLGTRGGPTAQMCEEWMAPWAARLRPHVFSIVGGEPTLNRDLARIVQSTASLWPRSQIRVVTNGLLLAKHEALPAVMAKLRGRAFLDISSHHASEEFQARFRPVRELAEKWAKDGVDVRINAAHQNWTRRYAVHGDQIQFLNGDPRSAWLSCIGKHSRQIYLGKLWKCPPITYFELLPGSIRVEPVWRNLAGSYQALAADCSKDELAAFLAREEEDICRLCPSTLERFELPNPLRSQRDARRA